MEFKLAPVAKSDVLEITDYYAEIYVELAERFVSELETTLHGLCSNPGPDCAATPISLLTSPCASGSLTASPFCCSIALMAPGSRSCVSCMKDVTFPPI